MITQVAMEERTHKERLLILIENGHYSGYGYLDEYTQVSSLDDIKGIINTVHYYPDADDLVKGWMRTNSRFKKVELKAIQ